MLIKSEYVSSDAVLGNSVTIGIGTIVEAGVQVENNVTVGDYCIIRTGAIIGTGTVIMDYVEIRSGTLIGENCYIDSRVSTSGSCRIGRNVSLRYGVVIAKGCEIGDDSYLCPRVMTNNLDQGKNAIGGAKIGKRCFIGTNAVLQHGISLGNETVVGAMAFVNKSFPAKVTLVGSPARIKP